MLKLVPWANAITATAVVAYVALWLLSVVAPALFTLVFNAQFLGADVASLYPTGQDMGTAFTGLVVVGVTAWLFGYLWAWFYNRFAQ